MNEAMAQAEQVQQVADHVAAALPVWLDVVLGLLGVWGIFLWLFGRRLVRPTVTMLGLLAGGLAAGLIARPYTDGAALAGWALGGGIAGGLVVWVTFRIWIGLALAIVLGAAAPWAVLAWEGAEWPVEAGQSIRDAAEGRSRRAGSGFSTGKAPRTSRTPRGKRATRVRARSGRSWRSWRRWGGRWRGTCGSGGPRTWTRRCVGR
jgi:hypothetical protein